MLVKNGFYLAASQSEAAGAPGPPGHPQLLLGDLHEPLVPVLHPHPAQRLQDRGESLIFFIFRSYLGQLRVEVWMAFLLVAPAVTGVLVTVVAVPGKIIYKKYD